MFKCEKCGNNSEPGETQFRVVVATRKKEYIGFQRSNGTHDSGGFGHEIVREVRVHEACAKQLHVEIAEIERQLATSSATLPSDVVYSDGAAPGQAFNTAHI